MAMNKNESTLTSDEAYALSKRYVKETVEGGGAVAGKNVVVKSIDKIDGGNRVTFGYTLDDGTEKTSSFEVMDGVDGQDGSDGKDGVSPTVTVNQKEDGTITLDITDKDGTKTTPNLKGEKGNQGDQGIPGQKGDQGVPRRKRR